MYDGDIEYVNHLINEHIEGRKIIVDMELSGRSRLVWIMGIAGFALLNAKPYWEAIAGKSIIGIDNVWLSVPWIMSAFLGVIAYFLIDRTIIKEQFYYMLLIGDLHLFKFDFMGKKIDVKKLIQINKGEEPHTKKAQKEMFFWIKWTRWFERLAFTSLVAGFIWSVIGPLILK